MAHMANRWALHAHSCSFYAPCHMDTGFATTFRLAGMATLAGLTRHSASNNGPKSPRDRPHSLLEVITDGSITVTAIDPNGSYYKIGLPIIQKAGVEDKIKFIESEALPILDKLIQEINEGELFHFAFVDGDKRNYGNYHERLMKHVRIGGLIVYDNMLWFGMVAVPENPQHEESMNSIREYFINFNKMHAADNSIELSLICMADGVTVCRRIA
ncbi:hypothetical protein KSP40_PGU002821 [Platanthera guangdongensis]|uniref:norbelladine O-methyltransferase n=1 Tax=Platanthera guangdongensis TaxID=2320717 RepID=A0ABR2LKX8_9ASPA